MRLPVCWRGTVNQGHEHPVLSPPETWRLSFKSETAILLEWSLGIYGRQGSLSPPLTSASGLSSTHTGVDAPMAVLPAWGPPSPCPSCHLGTGVVPGGGPPASSAPSGQLVFVLQVSTGFASTCQAPRGRPRWGVPGSALLPSSLRFAEAVPFPALPVFLPRTRCYAPPSWARRPRSQRTPSPAAHTQEWGGGPTCGLLLPPQPAATARHTT